MLEPEEDLERRKSGLSLSDVLYVMHVVAERGGDEATVHEVWRLLRGDLQPSDQSKEPAEKEEYFNKSRARAYLELSKYMFEKLLDAGVIPGPVKRPTGLRWRKSDLEKVEL